MMLPLLRLLALCLLLLPFAAVHAQSRARQPVEIDRVLAVVNDEAITLLEAKNRVAGIERQLRSRGTPMPPREVLARQVLERLIMDRVQVQFAKDAGMTIPDAELDASLRRIAEGNRLSVQDFRAALVRDGVDWNRFRDEIRNEMIIGRLREREVESRIVISEGEIDNYLANPESQNESEVTVNLAHIVIRVPEQADPAQLMRIGARAQQALKQAQAGEDFSKVAASFSEAPDGLAGGIMGPRPLDRLPNLYADAVQKMKPGEISGILRSPAGFHILKLIERSGGGSKANQSIRQTRASHILIKVNEIVSDPEAKRKLDVLKERLVHGGNFAELARLHSNDLSAAKGGDLGWLYQGDTVPEFERAMDALKPGEISQPVRSPFGWHLILVHERRTDEASKDRQRMAARMALRERKSDEAYEDWLRQMRDRAYVEYRLDEQ